MPLDHIVDVPLYSQRQHFDRSYWELKFVLWPRHCYLTNKRLWLTQAYRGTRVITGPGEPAFVITWMSKQSFTVAALGGNVNG